MKINLEKIVPTFSNNKEIENLNYFAQFNVCETIEHNIKFCKNECSYDYNPNIYDVEYTCPNLNIIAGRVVNTIEGVSLEGQCLTGKKIVITGEIVLCLVITYSTTSSCPKSILKRIKIPFSTFIIIPKHICSLDVVNIKYLIEDISVVEISVDKILVSLTVLIQYVDNY